MGLAQRVARPQRLKPEPWPVDPDLVAPEWRRAFPDHLFTMWGAGSSDVDYATGQDVVFGASPVRNVTTRGEGWSVDAGDEFLHTGSGNLAFDPTEPWTIFTVGLYESQETGVNHAVFLADVNDSEWVSVGGGSNNTEWKVYSNGQTPGSGSVNTEQVGTIITIALTWDGSVFRSYINGVLDQTVTPNGTAWISGLDSFGVGDGEGLAKSASTGADGATDFTHVSAYAWGERFLGDQIAQLHRVPFGFFRKARRDYIAAVIAAGGGAQTISAPVAVATAEASAPQVAPATSVPAPGASASAEARSPSLAATVDLSPPVAPGTAEATAPTVSPGDPTPTAPVAPSSAEAPAPSVSPTVTLSLPVSPVTAEATAPSVVQVTSLALSVASALAEANPPGVSPGAATVSLEAAQAIADAAAPQVAASVGVGSPVADVDVTALPPSVQAAISLAAAGADVEATATAPQVSPGTASPTVPVATVTVTVVGVTVLVGELFVNTVTGEAFIARSLSGDASVAREAEGDVSVAQTLSGDVEV